MYQGKGVIFDSVPLILICQSGCSQIKHRREVYWPVVVRSFRSPSTNLLTELLIIFFVLIFLVVVGVWGGNEKGEKREMA
jgi:hypothetical protein